MMAPDTPQGINTRGRRRTFDAAGEAEILTRYIGGSSCAMIARTTGMSENGIRAILHRNGVAMRGPGGKTYDRIDGQHKGIGALGGTGRETKRLMRLADKPQGVICMPNIAICVKTDSR